MLSRKQVREQLYHTLSETRGYSKRSFYPIRRTGEGKGCRNVLVMQSCHQFHWRHFIRLPVRSSQPPCVYCSGEGTQTPFTGNYSAERITRAAARFGCRCTQRAPAPITPIAPLSNLRLHNFKQVRRFLFGSAVSVTQPGSSVFNPPGQRRLSPAARWVSAGRGAGGTDAAEQQQSR